MLATFLSIKVYFEMSMLIDIYIMFISILAGFIQIVQTSLGQQMIATSAVSSVATTASAGMKVFTFVN